LELHPAYLRVFVYLFRYIWGSSNTLDSIKKTIIWLLWTISPGTMGQMIWLGAYF
jgi:hypothetical protein